jgi:hypothetical protein
MNISSELQKEFFAVDVTFSKGIAKWQNYKHPENSNFQQKVFWAAWVANNNLIVVYYLDPTNIGKNYSHKVIPLRGLSFEDAVFNHWIEK